MPERIRYHGSRPSSIKADDAAAKRERDKFYSSARWMALRKRKLAKHPLCEPCLRMGETTAASVVHHVEERLARPDLAYHWPNLESSCGPCHTAHHKRKG